MVFFFILGIATTLSMFASRKCVCEDPVRLLLRFCTVSKSREVAFEDMQKQASIFCSNPFFFTTLREWSWLAGEMTKRRVGAQRGRGEKRLRVQIF